MNTLGKVASVATVIAAVFTVLTYYESHSLDNALKENEKEFQREHLPRDDNLVSETVSPTKLTKEGADGSICQQSDYTRDDFQVKFEIAKMIPGSTSQNEALEGLGKKAAQVCYFDLAYTIGKSIRGSTTKSDTLSYIAIKAANSGNLSLAAKIADSIPGSTTKSRTLKMISEI